MIRNSRTPTLLVVGLIVIIMILLYNYWNLLEHNTLLRDRLILNEDKLSSLNEKKSQLEKEGSRVLDQIKEFEDKIEKSSQALTKKDSEIDELNTKLSAKEQENVQMNNDLNDLKDKLKTCALAEVSKDDLEKQLDKERNTNNELKLNLSIVQDKLNQKLTNPLNFNCTQPITEAINSFKTRLSSVVRSNFIATEAEKFIGLFEEKTSPEKPKELLDSLSRNPTVQKFPRGLKDIKTDINVCLLAKDIGKCDNSTDRYYFHAESQTCLQFSYNGCEGNGNNFETIEMCKNTCLNVTNKNDEATISETETKFTLDDKKFISNNII